VRKEKENWWAVRYRLSRLCCEELWAQARQWALPPPALRSPDKCVK